MQTEVMTAQGGERGRSREGNILTITESARTVCNQEEFGSPAPLGSITMEEAGFLLYPVLNFLKIIQFVYLQEFFNIFPSSWQFPYPFPASFSLLDYLIFYPLFYQKQLLHN